MLRAGLCCLLANIIAGREDVSLHRAVAGTQARSLPGQGGLLSAARVAQRGGARAAEAALGEVIVLDTVTPRARYPCAVSYTHLTLPTKA